MAGFLGRIGQTKEALDICIKARETCPAESVAMASAGLLRAATDEAVKAAGIKLVRTWLEKVCDEKPSPELLTSLADLIDLSGNYDEAKLVWRKVLSLDPGNIMALNNLSCLIAYRPDSGTAALDFINRAIARVGRDA